MPRCEYDNGISRHFIKIIGIEPTTAKNARMQYAYIAIVMYNR